MKLCAVCFQCFSKSIVCGDFDQMELQRCSIELQALSSNPISSSTYCLRSLKTGFKIDGRCTANCSSLCTDPRILFSNEDIFAGCLHGKQASDPQLNPSFDSDRLLFELNGTITLVDTCMQEYCTRYEISGINANGCPYISLSGAIEQQSQPDQNDLADLFVSETGACNVSRTINADIGGPGVSSHNCLAIP